MNLIRRFIATIFLAAGLLGATACESLPKEQVAQIASGEKPAVILDYKPWEGWWGADLTLVNLQTRAVYRASMHGGANIVGAGPALVPVEPGRYRIISGYANGGNATATLPLLQFWFKDFEVGRGEIVDLGTFSFQPVNVYSDAGALGGLANALFRLDPRDAASYMTYSIDTSDNPRIQQMLADKYPALIGKPVKRPLEVVLSKQQFEQIVVEAYKPREDGRLPATADAEKKVSEALRAFLVENLKTQAAAP